MKKLLFALCFSFGLLSLQTECCPTCQGRIQQDSAPFFTDDFYKPTAESMDYIYQQMLEEEAAQQQEEPEA